MDEDLRQLKTHGNMRHLHLVFGPEVLSSFFEIMQNGFNIACRVGITVKSLLCEETGLSPQYVAERISTIFLDGKCVDNIDSAIIKERSVLALSAALPGLAGATLRREGAYASLRSSITYNEHGHSKEQPGTCSVKLFNLLIKDLGPVFLERGVLIHTGVMENFLRKQPDDFWRKCSTILFDARPVDKRTLLENIRHIQDNLLLLTAKIDT